MATNWQTIDDLVKAHRSMESNATEEALLRELRIWWCVKYNRPFKDPLLEHYTMDELIYEYLTHYYLDPENDPAIKKSKELQAKDDDEWVRKQLEAEASKNAKIAPAPDPKPNELPPELPEISAKFD